MSTSLLIPEKGHLQMVSPKVKIGCIFRKLNQNKKWLTKVIEEYIKYNQEIEKDKDSSMDLENDLIDAKDKMVLLVHKSYRTDAEITTIAEKLKFLMPFIRYPLSMIEDLVRHSNLQGYEAGRTLYLPNQEPMSAYFILSGVVQVVPEETSDPVSEFQKRILLSSEYEQVKSSTYDIYTPGHMLGRKELLFGEPRKRLAMIKEDILCIKFDKTFMLETLKPILERWVKVFSYLNTFHLFCYLDKDVMRELCKVGRIKKYGVQKLINAIDTSCFLIEGEAYVIQRLLIQRYIDKGKWSLRLYKDQNATEYDDDVDSVFMQVMVLNKGAYFGLGERMSKHIIWTKQPSKFVQFPRTELFEYGDYSVWEGQRIYLDGLYPTTEQLFKFFLYGREWLKYKKELTNTIRSNKRHRTIHNVPMPLRCNHMKLRKSSIKKLGITLMDDYLKGGLDPLEDEIKNAYVLDKGGDLRDKLFCQYKTKPDYKPEPKEVVKGKEFPGKYDSFPSFFFYNALKKEGLINED